MLDWRSSTLPPDDGDYATIDAVDGFERLLDGASSAPPAGPLDDLVGLSVPDVDVRADIDLGLALEIPEGGFDVGPDPTEVPAYVSARYDGEPMGWAALALDDEIVAVTRIYESGSGTSDLAALLPPERLTPGRHELEVFVIEGAGDDRVLRSAGVF